MDISNIIRQHWAALRALLALTLLLGLAYPVFVWLVAQLPGLKDNANGTIVAAAGEPVGSSLIGQAFTDADGNPLPQYFQSRSSYARGPDDSGYNPLSTSAGNLGPESIVDTAEGPSLLTLVCSRSAQIGELDGVSGARPYCTGDGVGAVLSVIGPRDVAGKVTAPTRVVSVNQPCSAASVPFLASYQGVTVECARPGENYSAGQIVPIRGAAPEDPAVPADAVTASASGLDPDISVAYAELQVPRVAAARGISADQVREIVATHTSGRALGFMGQPRVNVLAVNLALDADTR